MTAHSDLGMHRTNAVDEETKVALRVNLEQLLTSAAHAVGHGEDLATRHLVADNRIESATPGWTGRSAQSLARRVSLWTAESTALVARIGDHASDLHTSMDAFATMETHNCQVIADLGNCR